MVYYVAMKPTASQLCVGLGTKVTLFDILVWAEERLPRSSMVLLGRRCCLRSILLLRTGCVVGKSYSVDSAAVVLGSTCPM